MKRSAGLDLSGLTDFHSGEIGIVIGTSPNLVDVPCKLLRRYPAFCLNVNYKLPFQPSYFICIDRLLLQNLPAVVRKSVESADLYFISDDHTGEVDPGLRHLYSRPNCVPINQDTFRQPGDEIPANWSHLYLSLMIAYQMGFSTMLLVGLDNYAYWSNSYFQPGELANARGQEVRKIIQCYQHADALYRSSKRRIVNLSPPSRFDSVFSSDRIANWI